MIHQQYLGILRSIYHGLKPSHAVIDVVSDLNVELLSNFDRASFGEAYIPGDAVCQAPWRR